MSRRGVAILLLVVAVRAEGDPVTARLDWEPGYFGKYKLRAYPLTPKEGGNRVATIPFGPKHRMVVVLGATEYRADRNLDGDLQKEEPTKLGDGNVFTVAFPAPGLAEPLPVPVYFKVIDNELHVATRMHRRGVVELAGRIRPVVLVDGDGDFRFDDAERDRLYLDIDGEDDIEERDPNHELIHAGRPFRLRERGYVARVTDPLGGSVEFREVSPAPPERRWYFQTVPAPAPWTAKPKPGVTLADCKQRYARGNQEQQLEALRDAAQLGTRAALTFLFDASAKAKSYDVRKGAMELTGYLPPKYAAQVAKVALTHADPNIRGRAVKALHWMNAPNRAKTYAALLADFPNPSWTLLYTTTARRLAYVGDSSSRKTLARLFKRQKDFGLRKWLYDSGTHHDPDGAPTELMLAALDDDEQFLEADALWDLWLHRDSRARPHALKVLERRDLEYRLEDSAIRVLATQGDEDAVRAVLERVPRGSERIVAKIRRLLRPVRDPSGIRGLERGLQHRSAVLRAFCAELLAALPRPHVTESLVTALGKEKNKDAKIALAEAVAEHGDTRAVKPLLALAKGDNDRAVAALAQLDPGDPDVRKFFAQRLAVSRWKDRLLALGVVNADQLPGVVENLVHERWEVRLAAIGALRRFRKKDGIEPLIARLAEEPRARVRWTIGQALYLLTGKDIGVVADAWRAWWKTNGADFVVPEQPPQASAAGRSTATFYGLPVHSGRVCFVIDASGSMADPGGPRGSRLAIAKAEVASAIKNLGARDKANVIVFDTKVSSWRSEPVVLNAANRKSLAKFLEKLEPGARTNLFDALTLAFKQEDLDTVFVLSDGRPNAGAVQSSQEILRALSRLNQHRRLAIHSVAVGVDSDLLKRIAATTGGTYVRR